MAAPRGPRLALPFFARDCREFHLSQAMEKKNFSLNTKEKEHGRSDKWTPGRRRPQRGERAESRHEIRNRRHPRLGCRSRESVLREARVATRRRLRQR